MKKDREPSTQAIPVISANTVYGYDAAPLTLNPERSGSILEMLKRKRLVVEIFPSLAPYLFDRNPEKESLHCRFRLAVALLALTEQSLTQEIDFVGNHSWTHKQALLIRGWFARALTDHDLLNKLGLSGELLYRFITILAKGTSPVGQERAFNIFSGDHQDLPHSVVGNAEKLTPDEHNLLTQLFSWSIFAELAELGLFSHVPEDPRREAIEPGIPPLTRAQILKDHDPLALLLCLAQTNGPFRPLRAHFQLALRAWLDMLTDLPSNLGEATTLIEGLRVLASQDSSETPDPSGQTDENSLISRVIGADPPAFQISDGLAQWADEATSTFLQELTQAHHAAMPLHTALTEKEVALAIKGSQSSVGRVLMLMALIIGYQTIETRQTFSVYAAELLAKRLVRHAQSISTAPKTRAETLQKTNDVLPLDKLYEWLMGRLGLGNESDIDVVLALFLTEQSLAMLHADGFSSEERLIWLRLLNAMYNQPNPEPHLLSEYLWLTQTAPAAPTAVAPALNNAFGKHADRLSLPQAAKTFSERWPLSMRDIIESLYYRICNHFVSLFQPGEDKEKGITGFVQIQTILGGTGSGKTYLAKQIADHIRQHVFPHKQLMVIPIQAALLVPEGIRGQSFGDAVVTGIWLHLKRSFPEISSPQEALELYYSLLHARAVGIILIFDEGPNKLYVEKTGQSSSDLGSSMALALTSATNRDEVVVDGQAGEQHLTFKIPPPFVIATASLTPAASLIRAQTGTDKPISQMSKADIQRLVRLFIHKLVPDAETRENPVIVLPELPEEEIAETFFAEGAQFTGLCSLIATSVNEHLLLDRNRRRTREEVCFDNMPLLKQAVIDWLRLRNAANKPIGFVGLNLFQILLIAYIQKNYQTVLTIEENRIVVKLPNNIAQILGPGLVA